MPSYVETERKWRCSSAWPDTLCLLGESVAERQYLSVSPEIRLSKRVRGDGETHFHLAFKGEGTLQRSKVRLVLSSQEYNSIRSMISYPPLIFRIRVGADAKGRRIVFKHCKQLDLSFAEIEFDSPEESRLYDEPPFLMEEVTGNSQYYGKYMWCRYYGLPLPVPDKRP